MSELFFYTISKARNFTALPLSKLSPQLQTIRLFSKKCGQFPKIQRGQKNRHCPSNDLLHISIYGKGDYVEIIAVNLYSFSSLLHHSFLAIFADIKIKKYSQMKQREDLTPNRTIVVAAIAKNDFAAEFSILPPDSQLEIHGSNTSGFILN